MLKVVQNPSAVVPTKHSLKACPLCGSKAVIAASPKLDLYFAGCGEFACPASGPLCRKEKDAVEAWNRQ